MQPLGEPIQKEEQQSIPEEVCKGMSSRGCWWLWNNRWQKSCDNAVLCMICLGESICCAKSSCKWWSKCLLSEWGLKIKDNKEFWKKRCSIDNLCYHLQSLNYTASLNDLVTIIRLTAVLVITDHHNTPWHGLQIKLWTCRLFIDETAMSTG